MYKLIKDFFLTVWHSLRKVIVDFVKMYISLSFSSLRRMNIFEHFIVLFFAFYTTLAFFGSNLFLAPDKIFNYDHVYLYVLLSFMLYLLVMPVMLNFKFNGIQQQTSNGYSRSSATTLFITTLVVAIINFSFYLLIFYPAAMSYDSLYAWNSIYTHTYTTTHSFLYIFIQLLLLKLWYSPAIIAITQIIFMSLTISYTATFFYKRGLQYKKVLISTIFFILIPINGMLSIVLWKDIPFTIALVFLGLNTVNIFKKQSSIYQLLSLGVFSALVYFFRHNGVIASSLVLLLTFITMIVTRRLRLLAPIVMFICCYLFVTQGLYRIYSVSSYKISYTQMKMPAIISTAYILKSESELPESLQSLTGQLNSVKWDSLSLFTNSYPTEFNTAVATLRKEASYYYVELLKHSPLLVLRTYLNYSNIVWSVPTPTGSYIAASWYTIDENSFGLVQPCAEYFWDIKMALYRLSQTAPLNIFIIRGGLLNVFILFTILVFFVRKQYVKISVLTPHIANVLSLLVSCPSQDYRYIYSVLPFAFIAFGLLFVRPNVLSEDT